MKEQLKTLLESAEGESVADTAVRLARWLLARAAELQTNQEKRQQMELDRMIHNPHDKSTLITLTDQAFRSHIPHRAVDQLVHLLDVQGIPRFFTPLDRTLLKGFQSFGSYLPDVAVPMIKANMRKETANVVLPAEWPLLTDYLGKRRVDGLRMNVNFLGEALLGERQAQQRLDLYLKALQQPEIEVLSVKISTIYSQINPLARRDTVNVIANRLERIYRTADNFRFVRPNGTRAPKFVYLDMEEYRDMWITAEAFIQALNRPGLESIGAGIALQAYVPDTFRVQRHLTEWAVNRVAKGGAPITIRVVKGANMEMERVDASLSGWPQAPYRTKLETDRNYKRMLSYGLEGEHSGAVRLGIASHNLFDLAYGMALAARKDRLDQVQFEMLEGMANHQRRALQELADNILLYAPACRKEDFIHAIGYLIRRLDENTGPDNFLRHTFRLEIDTPEWDSLKNQFREAAADFETLTDAPRKTQDRRLPADTPPLAEEFSNEPDTDFSLEANIDWAESIVEQWKERPCESIPVAIGEERIFEGRAIQDGMDPSRPGVVVARCATATRDDIDRAFTCAQEDPSGWRDLDVSERRHILREAAQAIRNERADLMGCAMAECGKILTESDPEVSEAVDFLEYYGRCAEAFGRMKNIECRGRGVAVVVSPWNFPIAIPAGGIAAALASGNTVLLKPSPDAVLTAWRLCECFWAGGVPQAALQFVPTASIEEAQYLVSHPKADVVIFTGGTETAKTILRNKPALEFFAETGGKNATIVTALADRDLAIKHVLQSAFSHSGQKCSATSLLILEDEIFEDEGFKEQLADATTSLHVGSAWDLKTRVGPLIRPPGQALDSALKELEADESWLVMPSERENNPRLFSPGIKWDVRPGSVTHLTEFFGPVLGVMRARNVMHAISLVHETGYGLTSGLESLDDREQDLWQGRVRAGNLYMNRSTTGAIVHRQPFGGMGKSAYGPGIKAGGPNYVLQFMQVREIDRPEGIDEVSDDFLVRLFEALKTSATTDFNISEEAVEKVRAAIRSCLLNMREEFGRAHDDFRLIGQDNIRRYLPVENLRIRLGEADSFFEVLTRVCAARIAGCRITLSLPHDLTNNTIRFLEQVMGEFVEGIEWIEESDDELESVIREGFTDRVRYARSADIPEAIRRTVPETGIYLAHAPVLMEGRLELLWYLREQSLCANYHRYGNLGGRSAEERSPVG